MHSDEAGLTDHSCEPGEDLANEIKLTDKTIIYMENKFKNGLKSVLEFLAQFK